MGKVIYNSLPTPTCPALSPAPANEGWDGDADANGPGGQDHHQCVPGAEAEAAEGFTDDNVALKGQEGQ